MQIKIKKKENTRKSKSRKYNFPEGGVEDKIKKKKKKKK